MKATTPAMAAALRIISSGVPTRTHEMQYRPDDKSRIEGWKADYIREWAGKKSHREIAEDINVSKTTVANYIARMRKGMD